MAGILKYRGWGLSFPSPDVDTFCYFTLPAAADAIHTCTSPSFRPRKSFVGCAEKRSPGAVGLSSRRGTTRETGRASATGPEGPHAARDIRSDPTVPVTRGRSRPLQLARRRWAAERWRLSLRICARQVSVRARARGQSAARSGSFPAGLAGAARLQRCPSKWERCFLYGEMLISPDREKLPLSRCDVFFLISANLESNKH